MIFMWKGDYNHHFCLAYNFSSFARLSSPPDGALLNFHHTQLCKWLLTGEKLHESFTKPKCFKHYYEKSYFKCHTYHFLYKYMLWEKNELCPYAQVIETVAYIIFTINILSINVTLWKYVSF